MQAYPEKEGVSSLEHMDCPAAVFALSQKLPTEEM